MSRPTAGSVGRAERICHERGVRLTPQRRRVFEILCAAARPMGAYEILEQMAGTTAGAKPPTVYRALEFLQRQGLVHRLESINAFVGCVHPDHPHAGQFLICSDCGEVSELEDSAVARSLQAAGKAAGFRTTRPVVELIGTCAQCDDRKQA